MRAKIEIDCNEPRNKKDEFFRKIRDTVPKAIVSGSTVDVDSNDERKVVDILTKTGVRYKKIA